MSPPAIVPQATSEFAKPGSARSSESAESFNFSSTSIDAARFDYSKSGPEKPRISGRSRPRLAKIGRRHMPDRKTVKTDLGLNGFSYGGGEKDFEGKLGNTFGINNGNSGSNGAEEKSCDVNENTDKFRNGFGSEVKLDNSLFGFGSGKFTSLFYAIDSSKRQSKGGDFSFGFDKDSSNFVQKEIGSFVFGACKEAPVANPDCCGLKKNGLATEANLESGQFVFGVGNSDNRSLSFNMKDNSDLASQAKLEQQGLHKSGLNSSADEFVKFDAVNFEFGASKTDKVAGSTNPDLRGKVKLDGFGASEKASNPSFKFPFNLSYGSSNDHENLVFSSDNTDFKFNVGLENKSAGKKGDVPKFTKSGKENAEIRSQSQDACLEDVFVFGGLKGKGGIDSGGGTKPANETNQLNRGKAEDCNVSELHSHNSGADTDFKFQSSGNSGDTFEQGPAFDITNKMKKLNIGDSKADATRSGNFTFNSALGANNAFVFGGNQKDSGFIEENGPSMNQKTPDMSDFSQSNSKSTLFPSAEMGFKLNSGFQEVPSVDKDENGNISFRGKLAGLGSDAECITPDMKFAFSSNNLFLGVDKLGNTSSKSLRDKKSKKRNGKVGQRTVVQQLFSQNQMFKEGSSEKNHESPGFGSPMDFSPYQDKNASNAPETDTAVGVKGESSANKKNISEHWENPEDDKSNSVFSPSLPAEDGLSAVQRQYKKKYKLKVGFNPTVKGNNSDKVNVKQEPTGTPNELCEHWRIRGNEAYRAGKLSKAEEFYSIGINSVPHASNTGYPLKPLLLCYSNRAATRMSLSRMREAIADTTKASELDPGFLKVISRAGNCYLVLGEVEDAIRCYNKCLRVGNSICLDRRFTIEASSSLQKAEKVAEYMHQCATLLQEGTDDAASRALGSIEDALSISRYSERLLEMKGEAMYILRMYDEVINLCEQTLDIAEKNFGVELLANRGDSSHVKLWRWHLQSKSHYRLGRLDLALDLIEKQEKMPISSKSGDVTKESSIALATKIRELLSLKKSGNEAFNSGRHTEAIESYTAAISKSFESRAFMAVCFCNRAAAYQSLSQIVDAISDCSVAIALDEDYPKAISRRATLHEMIRDYKQALNDIQRLVSLLESQCQSKTQSRPSGGSVRDLRKARRRLATVEEKAKKEIPLDLYLILGIKASDTESEIKKAYRKAALRHHPDKAGQVLVRSDAGVDGHLWKECGEKIHNDADRLFKIIGEAYAVLSDPCKRSKYDMEEEIRNSYKDSNRNSSSEHPSTSYSSPYDRGGSWSGRSGSYSTSFGRSSSSSRRNWYEAYPKTYSYSPSQW